MEIDRREFLTATAGASLGALARDVEAEQKMTNNTTGAELDFLKQHSTTVIESAVAMILGGHQHVSCTLPGLTPRSPDAGPLVGYAVTAEFSTDADDERGRRDNADYYHYVFAQPGPKVAVSLDASARPASGSSWGRLNANIHRALGCRGVITNGGVRDVEEINAIGFQVFSSHLTVGHGNPHVVRFGEAVTLLGARVNPGDVICADQHGAIVIPRDALPHVADAIAEGERRVSPVLKYCQAPGFTVAGLLAAQQKHMKNATPWKPTKRS